MTWQPIATIPRDGELVLLLKVITYHPDKNEEAWLYYHIGSSMDSAEDDFYKYWMPLPPPPKVSE